MSGHRDAVDCLLAQGLIPDPRDLPLLTGKPCQCGTPTGDSEVGERIEGDDRSLSAPASRTWPWTRNVYDGKRYPLSWFMFRIAGLFPGHDIRLPFGRSMWRIDDD